MKTETSKSASKLPFVYGLLLLAAVACEKEMFVPTQNQTETKVSVPVRIISSDFTKSARIGGREASIHDVSIAWYQNGTLVDSGEVSGSSGNITLTPGTYNFYVVANASSFSFPSSESSLSSQTISVPNASSFSYIPMSLNAGSRTVAAGTPLSFSLKRLAAKFNFNIVSDYSFGTFTATSMKLCQVATVAKPFASSYCAGSGDTVIDCDYASSTEIDTLNSGGTVTLYAHENMQGVHSEIEYSSDKNHDYVE